MPQPGSQGADVAFFERCSVHPLPDVQLQTLRVMAPMLEQKEKLKEIEDMFNMDTLMCKAAVVVHSLMVVAPDFPLSAIVPVLEASVKDMEKLSTFEASLQLGPEVKENIKKYISAFVVDRFFEVGKKLMTAVQDMERAIPPDYERLVETRNIQQLKAQLFSKRTHEAVTAQLDVAVAGTETLCAGVKVAGHLMSSPLLGAVRAHEAAIKQVRTYGTTVHGVYVLLHKLPPPGKNRERAAMLREHFGKNISNI